MKKIIMLVLTLSVFAVMTATASASWGVYYNSGENWSAGYHQDYEGERGLPFGWHDRYEAMRWHYHLERINEWEWSHCFRLPCLQMAWLLNMVFGTMAIM